MKYTLLNPLTGAAALVDASGLTRNLQVNAILLRGDEHIGIITHRDLVSFCRWCAGVALARCQTQPPEAHAALALVDKWLIDPGTVSSEELAQAASAAWDAAQAAYAAARAVARAAWDAAQAAYAAACAAARAAGDAAGAAAWATDAAWAAARAAGAAEASFEAQAQWLVEHLRSAQ